MASGRTDTTDLTLMENLRYAVERCGAELEQAEEDVKRVEEKRDLVRRRLESYKELHEFENRQLGHPLRDNPYTGLTLREAALRILERKAPQPVSFSDFISELTPWGFFVGRDYPSRSLHGALNRTPEAERVDQGKYRWANGKATNGITRPEAL